MACPCSCPTAFPFLNPQFNSAGVGRPRGARAGKGASSWEPDRSLSPPPPPRIPPPPPPHASPCLQCIALVGLKPELPASEGEGRGRWGTQIHAPASSQLRLVARVGNKNRYCETTGPAQFWCVYACGPPGASHRCRCRAWRWRGACMPHWAPQNRRMWAHRSGACGRLILLPWGVSHVQQG